MNFEDMYNELNALGVEVEWLDPATKVGFTAIINCETVTVLMVDDGLGNITYTVTSSTSQYPVEYIEVEEVYLVLSTEWVIYSGTKFTNVLPAKDGVVSVPFSKIQIGSYFYHGGLCLKVSDGSYFNSRIISLKIDTPVSLCVANVLHKPFVIL